MVAILKFGRRIEKTPEHPKGWQEIFTFHRGKKTDENLLGHKSVVCFTGDGTIYDEEMNGVCKCVEHMLLKSGVEATDMPHIYSLGFDTDTQGHRRKILDKEGLTRYGLPNATEVQEYWTLFFDNYILPLIQTKEGKALPIAETIQNFQNITFVSHCHGSIFAHQLEEFLSEKVKAFYPGREKEVLSHIRMLHLASRKPLGKDTGIKHLNIVSLADDMYADYGMLAEDHLYKMLHKQPLEARTAIIPISGNEAITVFREIATPKTYGSDRDDHRQMLQLIAGRGKNSDVDTAAQENEEGLRFVRDMLRYFVEHPDDTRSMKEIMKTVNREFMTANLNEGQRLLFRIKKENHISKSLLDFLGQYPLGKVSGDAHFFLQRMSDGQYFYEHLRSNAQKTGDFTSMKSVLKKAGGLISADQKATDIQEAIARRDWQMVDILTKYMLPKDISKYVLSSASPDDLPHLYTQLRRAKLSSTGQYALIDTLLEKSKKISNSAGRVKVQSFLRQEKSNTKSFVRIANNQR